MERREPTTGEIFSSVGRSVAEGGIGREGRGEVTGDLKVRDLKEGQKGLNNLFGFGRDKGRLGRQFIFTFRGFPVWFFSVKSSKRMRRRGKLGRNSHHRRGGGRRRRGWVKGGSKRGLGGGGIEEMGITVAARAKT